MELKDEKLMIKLDFENFWKDEKEETILVNKYGIIFTAVTINLNQILCQKLYAYLKRKQTLARDIYDIIWLIGQKAKIDNQFLKSNKIQAKKLLDQIKIKFEKEKKSLNSLKQKLAPYLFNEENGSKIFFFKQLIDELK